MLGTQMERTEGDADERRVRKKSGGVGSAGTDAHNRCLLQFPYCSRTPLGIRSNQRQKDHSHRVPRIKEGTITTENDGLIS